MSVAAGKIRVFVVDDSALVRSSLTMILSKATDIEVTGTASNPNLALTKMKKEWPDVIISDLEMPEMDGIAFLKHLNATRPTPFIVCSSYAGIGAKYSLEALSLGAVEIISKPSLGVEAYLGEIHQSILDAVRAAANVSVRQPVVTLDVKTLNVPDVSNITHDQLVSAASMIAIGSSTGGTTVIEQLLRQMQPDSPPLLIVQHMPMHFTQAFARRLNDCCRVAVKEAEEGDRIVPGTAYIAPGGKQMDIRKSAARGLTIGVYDGEPVNRHKPSVDVLFNAVAEQVGRHAVGVILTGMGRDGAAGLMKMKQAGAVTLAQDEASSAVFGMPRVALETGAASLAMPVPGLASYLASLEYMN